MGTLVVVGAQWGDEGKGKVVDLLAEKAEVVVRYAGGPNAGHTLVVGDDRIVLRLIPSGALHEHIQCVLGPGMVINPGVLVEEIDMLEAKGKSVLGRLSLSDRAHVILPYHELLDGLREDAASPEKRIGTTKRGIGPCYEDKAGRRGIRLGDLRDFAHTRQRVEAALANWTPRARALGATLPSVEEVLTPLEQAAPRLVPLLADTSLDVHRRIATGVPIMFEGAQGTLLDIDHGSFPFVTSSSAIAGGACTGAGIGPNQIDRVLGITKAYATRVGGGPFPSELDDERGLHLRDVGKEYGSVTGRPRRCGWLDLVALRYAVRVNGLDALAITKLDVLTGLDEVALCVAYDTPEGRFEELPSGLIFQRAKPVLEKMPGWTEDITACRTLASLPSAARAYLERITSACAIPADIVSVGPKRSETMVLRSPFAT